MHSYLQSLSHAELVNGGATFIYTFLIGFSGILGFFLYTIWEDRVEKQRDTAKLKNEKQSRVYGVRETAITIQYDELDDDEETFLRHVRALQVVKSNEDVLEVLDEFSHYLKSIHHPNYMDILEIQIMISHIEDYQENQVYYAEQWLHVAKSFWMIKPCDEMVPIPSFRNVSRSASDAAYTQSTASRKNSDVAG